MQFLGKERPERQGCQERLEQLEQLKGNGNRIKRLWLKR